MDVLLTPDQMRRLDTLAIRSLRLPGLLLMENAGRGVTERIAEHAGPMAGRSAVILCGGGNNGGDGFVIARHLLQRGARVEVVIPGGFGKITGDARTNLEPLLILRRLRHPNLGFSTASSPAALARRPDPDVIVDALFGTGFTGEVRPPYDRFIRWANGRRSLVVAVDIPSGVDAATGTVGTIAVRADLTVTMAAAKIGHFVGEGREHAGVVEVVDIGIPPLLFSRVRNPVVRTGLEDVRRGLPRRPLRAHKYSAGKLFILAGSRAFTGAPAMTAIAAMRSGAGAVVLGVPASVHAILARKLTEVILLPLPETADGSLAPEALERAAARAAWADAVAIGPGLSLNEQTALLVRRLLTSVRRPVVLDADGLTAAAADTRCLLSRRAPTILTPHAGELARLVRKPSAEIERLRVRSARDAAGKLKSTVVLKGAPTVTAAPGGETALNSTGNPGMATIGSGDVLTGIVAALLAQGMDPPAAAWSGVFLHGMAGDMAATALGIRSVMAMDLIRHLPQAFRSVEGP